MKKNFYSFPIMFVAVVFFTKNISAQDIHFSQMYENSVLRNPALTGIFSGDYKAGINYRSQYKSFSVPFITTLASAETKFATNRETGDFVSMGVNLVYDKAGSIDFNSLDIYAAVNYNKSLEDNLHSYISVGFAGGYVQRSVDIAKMTFASQYLNGNYSTENPSGENIDYTNLHHFDLGAGISFNSSFDNTGKTNYYLGVAAYHVTQPKETFNPNEGFIRLTTRWTGSFGFRAKLDDHVGIIIHANYQNQKPYQELVFGTLVGYNPLPGNHQNRTIIYGGCFYRWQDAFIPTVKLEFRQYALTMSYDVSTGGQRIHMSAAGGYEISLSVKGKYPHVNPTENMKCPRFEVLDEAYN